MAPVRSIPEAVEEKDVDIDIGHHIDVGPRYDHGHRRSGNSEGGRVGYSEVERLRIAAEDR